MGRNWAWRSRIPGGDRRISYFWREEEEEEHIQAAIGWIGGGGGTAGTLFLLYVCSVCSMKYVLMYVCSIGQNRGHYRLLSLAFSTSAPVRPSRPEMPAGWMDGWMDGWTAAEMAVD